MQEVTVIIPATDLVGIKFRQEEFIGFAEINRSLRDFQGKQAFAWHFSVMIKCEIFDEAGIATADERAVLSEFERYLSRLALGKDTEKPNAVFLARIDWNKSRELIWRVYDPEQVDKPLREILGTEVPPREFDYRLDPDPDWTLSQWHLNG